jgi:alkanesulfonate monooxygenase SsuD/methylene tetrahydromethanopterin reductase-like flavin-dependent oxidoreductase (luciferase family)
MFGMLDPDGIAPFLEAVEQVLALLSAGTPHDARGRHRDFKERDHWTSRRPRPVTVPGIAEKVTRRTPPPVLVTAVAPFCRGVSAAAARGWDPITAHFLLPRWVATHRDSYLKGCAQGGRPPHLANWRVARSIFVADDLATARDYARGPGSPYVAYYRQLLTRLGRNGFARLFKDDPSIPDEAVTLDNVLDRLVIWGTPDKVADELEAFREAVGPFGTLLYAGHDWADAHLARRSMVLLAEQVQPRIARVAEVAE